MSRARIFASCSRIFRWYHELHQRCRPGVAFSDMPASAVISDRQLHNDPEEAVGLAHSLAARGEIYLGIDVLLKAIGPGFPDEDELYRARWGCLIDLLNKAVVHQAAEEAYEVTSFLGRFGIDPEEDVPCSCAMQDKGLYQGECGCGSDVDCSSSTQYDFDSNQGTPSIPSPPSLSEVSDTSTSSMPNPSVRVSTYPASSKREQFRQVKRRLQHRMSKLFKPFSNNAEEVSRDAVNDATKSKLRWWWLRRQTRALSNQVDSSRDYRRDSHRSHSGTRNSRDYTPCPVSESEISCASERSRAITSFAMMGSSTSASQLAPFPAEASTSRSRQWARSGYEDQSICERSRAATSFAIMETSASASRLATNQVESSVCSSQGFAPFEVSEHESREISERSRAATSFAMMEMSTSVSRLARTPVSESNTCESSGIVRFFGSFRFHT